MLFNIYINIPQKDNRLKKEIEMQRPREEGHMSNTQDQTDLQDEAEEEQQEDEESERQTPESSESGKTEPKMK